MDKPRRIPTGTHKTLEQMYHEANGGGQNPGPCPRCGCPMYVVRGGRKVCWRCSGGKIDGRIEVRLP